MTTHLTTKLDTTNEYSPAHNNYLDCVQAIKEGQSIDFDKYPFDDYGEVSNFYADLVRFWNLTSEQQQVLPWLHPMEISPYRPLLRYRRGDHRWLKWPDCTIDNLLWCHSVNILDIILATDDRLKIDSLVTMSTIAYVDVVDAITEGLADKPMPYLLAFEHLSGRYSAPKVIEYLDTVDFTKDRVKYWRGALFTGAIPKEILSGETDPTRPKLWDTHLRLMASTRKHLIRDFDFKLFPQALVNPKNHLSLLLLKDKGLLKRALEEYPIERYGNLNHVYEVLEAWYSLTDDQRDLLAPHKPGEDTSAFINRFSFASNEDEVKALTAIAKSGHETRFMSLPENKKQLIIKGLKFDVNFMQYPDMGRYDMELKATALEAGIPKDIVMAHRYSPSTLVVETYVNELSDRAKEIEEAKSKNVSCRAISNAVRQRLGID